MSIEFRSTGSVFDHVDDEGWVYLVNPVCCCAGVLGKGLAKAFADRWPEIVDAHRGACENGLTPGSIHVLDPVDFHIWIVLFPTKNHWRNPSRLKWIYFGLAELARDIVGFGDEIVTVVLPALGCGLGNLDWADVKPLIVSMASVFPQHRFVVYEPQGR